MATQINAGIVAIDGQYYGATTVLKNENFSLSEMTDILFGYYVPTADGALNAASTVGGFVQASSAPSGGKSVVRFVLRPSNGGVIREVCVSCASQADYATAVNSTDNVASIAPANSYTTIPTQP